MGRVVSMDRSSSIKVGQIALLLAVLCSACGKKAAPVPVDAGPSDAKRVSAGRLGANVPGVPGCREQSGAGTFTLGKGQTEEDPEDPELVAPFGVTLGGAAVGARGLAVGAVESRGNATHALLALLTEDTAAGRVLDLGVVHGDGEPPKLVLWGDRVAVVLPDMDAGGRTLRVGTIDSPASAERVDFHAALSTGRDESPAFTVLPTDSRLLLAWDELDSKAHRVFIRGVAFDAKGAGWGTAPKELVRDTDDVEEPRLSARPSGAWLAYLRIGAAQPGEQGEAKTREQTEGETRPLELEARQLEIVPLDGEGTPTARPIPVSKVGSHVVGFELSTLPDGTALLAYRDEDASPGVESTSLELARVAHDGSVTVSHVEDEKVGAGSPTLLFQSTATGPDALWLAVDGVAGETRLGRVSAEGKVVGELWKDAVLGSATPLLRHDGKLLVSRSRGTTEELEWLLCELPKGE